MKLGILGGTFDPIHEGHMAVADAACAALSLDRVLVIPSHHPPHRRTEPRASGYHRFAMVALTVLSRRNPEYVASDMELLAEDRSYTSLTLHRLQQEGHSASRLFFITGADAFAEIETWNNYPAILDLAHFVVVSRPNHPAPRIPELLPSLRDRVIMGRVEDAKRNGIWLIDAPTPDVSSTEIRRRIRDKESIEGMVVPEVATYIDRQGLYRTAGKALA